MNTLGNVFRRTLVIATLLAASLSGCATAGPRLLAQDSSVVRIAGPWGIQDRRRCAGSATERCYALHTDQAALIDCLGSSIGACEADPGSTLWASGATAAR